MTHAPGQGCSAQDLILVTGGVECGRCGARPPEPDIAWCAGQATDGPCPLPVGDGESLCWIHRTIADLKAAP